MTLVLKGYDELKQHFADTISILLTRNKKESIEQLEPTRRHQVKFIRDTIVELDKTIERNRDKKSRDIPPALLQQTTAALYGAMLVISKDITETLSTMQGSTLRDRLNDALGAEPSPEQGVLFYKSLNRVLKNIFIERESNKGINPEHFLRFIPLDTLRALMKKSHALEEAAINATVAGLVPNGEATTNAEAPYKIEKTTTSYDPATIHQWEQLKAAFDKLIIDELAAKNKASVSNLSNKNRVIQLSFLQRVANELAAIPQSKISSTDKTAILAGALYLVRECIGQEYRYPILSTEDIPGSIVHTGLSQILNVKAAKPEDIEVFVAAVNRFMLTMIADLGTEPKAAPKYKRATHLFSAIPGFSTEQFMELAQSIIRTCRNQALDIAYQKTLAVPELAVTATRPESVVGTVTGMVSTLFFGGKQPAPAETELKATAAVTMTPGGAQ